MFAGCLQDLFEQYAGSPMPLTPMMPGCPPLTPNGPPYHYSEPIPPAPSLSSSQSQPVFQQKLQQYQQQQHEISSSHSQSALPSQQKQQQQTHTSHFSNQYQESYPHTQTYQQPLQQQQPPQQQQQQPQQQQQHPASTTYLTSASQSVIPHYTQPAQTAQNYQLNGSQQVCAVNYSIVCTFLQAGKRNSRFRRPKTDCVVFDIYLQSSRLEYICGTMIYKLCRNFANVDGYRDD